GPSPNTGKTHSPTQFALASCTALQTNSDSQSALSHIALATLPRSAGSSCRETPSLAERLAAWKSPSNTRPPAPPAPGTCLLCQPSLRVEAAGAKLKPAHCKARQSGYA